MKIIGNTAFCDECQRYRKFWTHTFIYTCKYCNRVLGKTTNYEEAKKRIEWNIEIQNYLDNKVS